LCKKCADLKSKGRKLNQGYRVASRILLGQERGDAGIEGDQFSFSMERQAQQVRIGDLLMADNSRRARGDGIEQPDIVRPELVSGMCEVGLQERDSVCGCQRIR